VRKATEGRRPPAPTTSASAFPLPLLLTYARTQMKTQRTDKMMARKETPTARQTVTIVGSETQLRHPTGSFIAA
jgi:hypothetical protein